jgi:hypothetical protein
MQLYVLVYKIVSLRIACGNHEDSASSRRKLEFETQNRIRRLKELENKSELEVAQTLCDLYQEKLNSRSASYEMGMTRPPRSARTISIE